MRYRWLAALLAPLVLAACGGGDDDGDNGGGTKESAGAEGGEVLQFDQVRSFTVDYMRRMHDENVSRTDKKKVFCPSPQWSDDEALKQQTADIHQAASAELLSCVKTDAAVSYLEFEDSAAAREAPATEPTTETATVVAGSALVTALFVGASELAYIEALKAECGCGEVVEPKAAG
jgi:hypothetical protein